MENEWAIGKKKEKSQRKGNREKEKEVGLGERMCNSQMTISNRQEETMAESNVAKGGIWNWGRVVKLRS